MTPKGSERGEAGLSDTIQNLIVSGIRLSTGLTLFGLAQLQKIVDATSDKGLPGAAEKIESALVELSRSLESNMDETKREALRSVSRVSAKAVEKAFETLSPEAVLNAGNRLLARRDETPAETTTTAVPLAVDVLSGPPGD